MTPKDSLSKTILQIVASVPDKMQTLSGLEQVASSLEATAYDDDAHPKKVIEFYTEALSVCKSYLQIEDTKLGRAAIQMQTSQFNEAVNVILAGLKPLGNDSIVPSAFLAKNIFAINASPITMLMLPFGSDILLFTDSLAPAKKLLPHLYDQLPCHIAITDMKYLQDFLVKAASHYNRKQIERIVNLVKTATPNKCVVGVLNHLATCNDPDANNVIRRLINGVDIPADISFLNELICKTAFNGNNVSSNALTALRINKELTTAFTNLLTDSIFSLEDEDELVVNEDVPRMCVGSSAGILKSYSLLNDIRTRVQASDTNVVLEFLSSVLDGQEFREIQALEFELKEQREESIKERLKIVEECTNSITSLKDSHVKTLEQLKVDIGVQLAKLHETHQLTLKQIEEEHLTELQQLKDEHKIEMEQLKQQQPVTQSQELTKLNGDSYKITREEVSRAVISNLPASRIFHVDASIRDAKTILLCYKTEDDSVHTRSTKEFSCANSDEAEMVALNELLSFILRHTRQAVLIKTDSLQAVNTVKTKSSSYNVRLMEMFAERDQDVFIQWHPRQMNTAGHELERKDLYIATR